VALDLDVRDRALLSGERGEAARTAMNLLVRVAHIARAPRFIDIAGAHIDSCLWHGRAGLDFAERLGSTGATVAVPTTLNVSSLDLLHPDRYRGDAETAACARRLMDAYVSMGCRPTWTCAPYQLEARPARGEHVAWAESNAIVFANSVLGARTDRYGDFIDICAAVTGRVPLTGLHVDGNRRGQLVFDVSSLPPRLLREDVLAPVLGHLVGRECGGLVPIIVGLPADTDEDRLKALGAAAASSGAVALFHAVGVTPEAPTLEAALQGGEAERIDVTPERIVASRDELSTTASDALGAISLGTPHFSLREFERLAALVGRVHFHDSVDVWVSTGRDVLAAATERGFAGIIERAGARIVTDTCTYITPILRGNEAPVMTNSAKWAWYAPGNLGVDVVFGSLEECVHSAVAGRVERDRSLWAQ
jgi:predicted aconitase